MSADSFGTALGVGLAAVLMCALAVLVMMSLFVVALGLLGWIYSRMQKLHTARCPVMIGCKSMWHVPPLYRGN